MIGKLTVKIAPPPSARFAAETRPAWNSAIRRTM